MSDSTISVDRNAPIVNLKESPFFADIEQIDLTNPFSDTNIFAPGLTIDNLPPRPSRPPLTRRLRIKRTMDKILANI